MAEGRKVIPVDFVSRRRIEPSTTPPVRRRISTAVATAEQFVLFAKSGRGPQAALEYLGGRWRGEWVLFVWTNPREVADAWSALVDAQGYMAQELPPEVLLQFLERAGDVAHVLINGALDPALGTVQAGSEQLWPRRDILTLLDRVLRRP